MVGWNREDGPQQKPNSKEPRREGEVLHSSRQRLSMPWSCGLKRTGLHNLLDKRGGMGEAVWPGGRCELTPLSVCVQA